MHNLYKNLLATGLVVVSLSATSCNRCLDDCAVSAPFYFKVKDKTDTSISILTPDNRDSFFILTLNDQNTFAYYDFHEDGYFRFNMNQAIPEYIFKYPDGTSDTFSFIYSIVPGNKCCNEHIESYSINRNGVKFDRTPDDEGIYTILK